jgi:dipeptidase
LYSPDVVTFAEKIGLYSSDNNSSFSFSDTYDPVTFSGARACEARVWDMFRHIVGDNSMDQYLDYVQGYNLTNRMPLWVKPAQSLSVSNVMELMRSHYEDSWFEMTGTREPDAGAMDWHGNIFYFYFFNNTRLYP